MHVMAHMSRYTLHLHESFVTVEWDKQRFSHPDMELALSQV